ncbi:Lrp/AsnC family transcriptional regulator [Kocuria sp.]|uniref:Lrp/AsnC family transcriptional regulator n=1 Tax=Kocuria sp. TaxID=1871328 RepID=UPI0026DB6589|nr:Lrp/AsnC family transcriptional regulator [Kocuria sp.]MDO4918924.1 Lrp/AsnC family transcriptional regulator [Kocuria sp.]
MARQDREDVELDGTDRRILEELTRDARQSVTALAATVHISRAHAYERIRRLHERGVVLRYTAVIDPVKAGLEASAYVTLRLKQNTWDTLRPKLRAIPQVQHVALVGGTFDVMLLVRARGTAELREVIFDRLQPMPEVVDTQTFLVFEDVDVRG